MSKQLFVDKNEIYSRELFWYGYPKDVPYYVSILCIYDKEEHTKNLQKKADVINGMISITYTIMLKTIFPTHLEWVKHKSHKIKHVLGVRISTILNT